MTSDRNRGGCDTFADLYQAYVHINTLDYYGASLSKTAITTATIRDGGNDDDAGDGDGDGGDDDDGDDGNDDDDGDDADDGATRAIDVATVVRNVLAGPGKSAITSTFTYIIPTP